MPTLCHFETHAASHIPELLCATVTQLLEIECRDVWRELVNYTEGDLTPEMRDRIERHLQGCSHCRAVYDGSQNIVRLLGGKNVFDLPRGFSQRLYDRLSSMR
jgi:anti-sigma factor (TIGR02949 family)